MKKITMLLTALLITLSASAQTLQKGKITNVNSSRFAKVINDEQTQIIDVRTSLEYEAGCICGATETLNFNVLRKDEFIAKISTLDRSRPVAIYCKSGGRSKVAAKILSDHDFRVFNLTSGFSGWKGDICIPVEEQIVIINKDETPEENR